MRMFIAQEMGTWPKISKAGPFKAMENLEELTFDKPKYLNFY